MFTIEILKPRVQDHDLRFDWNSNNVRIFVFRSGSIKNSPYFLGRKEPVEITVGKYTCRPNSSLVITWSDALNDARSKSKSLILCCTFPLFSMNATRRLSTGFLTFCGRHICREIDEWMILPLTDELERSPRGCNQQRDTGST
jgi:hypothetical protein